MSDIKRYDFLTESKGDNVVNHRVVERIGGAYVHYDDVEPLLDELERLRAGVDKFHLAYDNSDPPQLWVWRGEPGDETAEPWQRVIVE